MNPYFVRGFKDQLQKESNTPDTPDDVEEGTLDLDAFHLENQLEGMMPEFEDLEGVLGKNDIKADMPDSQPQKTPDSLDASK